MMFDNLIRWIYFILRMSVTTLTYSGNLGNSIEAISLKGNRLSSLQEDVFLSLTNIKSLELHLNPWRCDCHLKQFRSVFSPPLQTFKPK